MNKQLKKIIFTAFACVGFILPTVVFARKTVDYIPPSFGARLLSSFITIVPGIALLSLAAYFIMEKFDKKNSRKQKKIFVCIVTVLIITSSIWAAMDARNDELWSPALEGSNVATLIFPVAVILLNRRINFIKRLVIAALLVIPSYWLSLLIIYEWQELGMSIGLPTTW